MFVDIAKINIKAGNGGNGAVAFHREKYVAAGGPDGGDGGRGGNIVFQADDSLATLSDFRYKRKYKAPSGEDGRGARQNGKKGQDLIIRVPRGTVIREVTSGTIMADMSTDEPFIAAKGGKGGWGNSHFATSTRQTPRFAKSGAPGEEWDISLELKLIADVGLIGFPNVGKSSLLSVVSEAKPIIGDYHFTTIIPVLGVVTMGPEQSFVMADIPGLIEGASEGTGLGYEFLRHVERSKVLIHVLDAAGSEGRDPYKDFHIINNELEIYSPALAAKKQIVAANKIDLIAESNILQELRRKIEAEGYQFFPICTLTGEGINPLLEAAWKILQETPAVEFAPTETTIIYESPKNEFIIEQDQGVFSIKGKRVEKLIAMTDFDNPVSLRRFERAWKFMGLDKLLKKEGIQEGDTVNLYGVEFSFSDKKGCSDIPGESEGKSC